MSDKNEQSIEAKIAELSELLVWFESDDVTVDNALIKYERSQVLTSELNKALKEAQNTVEVIKKKYQQ